MEKPLFFDLYLIIDSGFTRKITKGQVFFFKGLK